MQLTQKETAYLKDAAGQEQLCISLYQKYSQEAQDPQLAQLLQTIAQQEQQHLQTIQQLQQGRIPQTGSQSGQQQGGSQQQQSAMNQQQGSGMQMQTQGSTAQMSGHSNQQSSDQQICQQLLSIEKAVSDLYDHAVFEFTNQQARKVLEHIQQEEHEHGYMLYQHMNQQGWYQAQ